MQHCIVTFTDGSVKDFHYTHLYAWNEMRDIKEQVWRHEDIYHVWANSWEWYDGDPDEIMI